jgi:hypothetical protein
VRTRSSSRTASSLRASSALSALSMVRKLLLNTTVLCSEIVVRLTEKLAPRPTNAVAVEKTPMSWSRTLRRKFPKAASPLSIVSSLTCAASERNRVKCCDGKCSWPLVCRGETGSGAGYGVTLGGDGERPLWSSSSDMLFSIASTTPRKTRDSIVTLDNVSNGRTHKDEALSAGSAPDTWHCYTRAT